MINILIIVSSPIITALPPRPPTISVLSRHPTPDDQCGEAMTLTCTANPVENLFASPTITWIDPSGDEVSSEGNDPRTDPLSRWLIFNDINTNNRGTYTCRITVSIPDALIVSHTDEMAISVNTNCELIFS